MPIPKGAVKPRLLVVVEGDRHDDRAEENEAGEIPQAVVGHRLIRALLALAQRIEAVAEFAGGFGLTAKLGDQHRRRAFAAGFEDADQVVDHFPDGQAGIL